MSVQQRRVFIVLSIIGLVYFALFIYPNSLGAGSDAILLDSSADEHITYPYVVRILTPGKTFNDTRANLFLYEDYHYGYPFYALSALTVLPVRLAYGLAFTDHMQLNLLLLRQVINILPMVLAAGLLVFLQTRFQSLVKSVALFILLLTIRGVVREHIWWWHPDALAVLCVALTLFFLDRDRLRFGRYFLLAAVFCGLATAIKLLGLFFFLAIPVYLLVGLYQKRLTWLKAARSAALFVLVMAAVVVFSNPFLFSSQQREVMLKTQAEKSAELSQGYSHDDPLYYSKGPQWWASTLEKWYAPPWFLLCLAGALAAGCLWAPRRLTNGLLMAWVAPYSLYLLYFVAVKPDHYWLPVMLPLFSAALVPLDLLLERCPDLPRAFFSGAVFSRAMLWQKAALALVLILLVWQVGASLVWPISGNLAVYQEAVQHGIVQIQTMR
jgi:hypothetical protein